MKKNSSITTRSYLVVAAIVCIVSNAFLTGCSKSPKPAASAKKIAKAADDSSSATSNSDERVEDESDPKPSDKNQKLSESKEVDSNESNVSDDEKSKVDADTKNADAPTDADDTESNEVKVDEVEPSTPERMLVFTGTGPLVIDFYISVDGLSLSQASEKLIDRILEMADGNSDGNTTWKELTTHRSFMYGQFGNPQVDSEQQRQEMVTTYDINRNQRVDRNEVLGYLRQNAADSKHFSLQQANAGDQAPPQSGVMKWLDANDDNLLESSEIANAVDRLWLNDIQDDQSLLANDFQTPQPAMQVRRSRYRRKRQGVLITEHTNWSKLLFELEEHYAYGNPLHPADLPGFESFFAKLDTNQDEAISTKEFSKVAEIEPHFSINAVFQRSQSPNVSVDVIDTTIGYEKLRVEGQTITIILANSSVTFDLGDEFANGGNQDQIAELFARADKNMDSYLTEEEYEQFPNQGNLSFEAIDTDEDEKVYLKELVATLEQLQQATANRVSSSIGQQNDVAFEYLDADRNGRLTTREVRAATSRLEQADTNDDGYVSLEEFPSSLSVSLRRGRDQNLGNVVLQRTMQTTAQNGQSNDWFTNMDTNRDGELSQSEFLGPISIFKKNDLDNDGFVTAEEMSQAQATSSDSE